MKCPIDATELVMTERQGVEIDYCPKCRGVWLDRGELDKIIDKAVPPVVPEEPQRETPPMQEYREPYREKEKPREYREPYRKDRYDDDRGFHDDREYRGKRRKSILSEIFDFD
ncbi:MAG: zf-TFIIB domain-containing protein [Paracoccaceae bacterium]